MKNDAIVAFVKKWLLCFAMTAGVCGYFLLDSYVHQEQNRRLIVEGVTGILPFLLFAMLFFEFSKINPSDLYLILSFIMRWLTPKAHKFTARFAKDKSYYLWAFCIIINSAQVTRIICQRLLGTKTTLLYCVYAGLLCLVNFVVGKKIGETSHDRISGGQSLGQKNTILAIWIGTTYLNPTSGIIMGAYMLWQNVCNALQLSYKRLR